VLVANQVDAPCDEARVEAAVLAALAGSEYAEGSISVAIVDDATIHGLNRQFLEHDYETDVLSFVLEDSPPRLEGEIVLSRDTAQRCAVEAGWTADDELLLYVVHGALHLAGYDDHDAADNAKMRAREAAILDRLGIRRSMCDSRWEGLAPGAQSSEGEAL
jgi:probable rRNA maturation factor